ncbi:MAG: 50S ribosomal protein L4 [Clostridiales bacterium]|jgi:large subunit ribosomal protein L4|nr:50S ribosomal protein L4 [Clostridiales bacterium]
MATVPVFNQAGGEVGTMELPDGIFGVEVNEHVVHMSVVQYLANQRQGTKSTKTRAEVRGGGRKPWRQKGTGRARQGSTRSPQWTGGGVVFAPKPRDFSVRLNKKEKRLALKSALTSKVNDKRFIVLDQLALNQIKTKDMKQVCDNLKLEKALIVINGVDRNVALSARNLPKIKTAAVNTINVYDILKYDTFVVTKEAVQKMQEVYA